RWSPTRTALAIAVSAGLTALMLGKNAAVAGSDLVPVDTRCVDLRWVEQLRAAVMRPYVEVLGPGDEGLELGTRVGQQFGVHPEPGGDGQPAVERVALLAHLGNGGLQADHRHDSLVAVVERLAAGALPIGENVLRRPRAALLGHAAELRQVVVTVR